ncbi:MAG: hypothetical protein IKA22_03050 [Lentisphaeria bacterium]|nr:hypothetical protein [Lentisphaeria bacterium]
MKVYKGIPLIHFRIGQTVTVMPWEYHRGQVIGIHIDHRNCVYYDVELTEPYKAYVYRRAKFTKGQLL